MGCCWSMRVHLILCFHFALLNSSLLSHSSSLPPPHLCRPEQSSALLKFKSGLSIAPGESLCVQAQFFPTPNSSFKVDSWHEGTDCCKWKGVTCDDTKGDVIGLDLSCSRITGSLQSNSALCLLRNLQWLNLACNSFTGSIPSTLANLTKITKFDISNNFFQGQIPDVFGNLNRLTVVDFSSNNFSGFLPSRTFNLTGIAHMDLSWNIIQGTLPNNLTGLPYLRQLCLSGNLLNGRVPSWLFSLPSLVLLDLNSNILEGPIDPIQEPNSVQYVDISNNEIQGSIPTSFFELVNLTQLDVSWNNLSGIIKSCKLAKVRNLQSLDLSYNSLLSLTRCSNDANSTLPEIVSFLFSSCNLVQFPSFLNASNGLTVLDLSNNKIQGSITKWEAAGWEGLFNLNLSMNFMASIEQFPGKQLMILDLHSNSLQGPLPVPPQTMSVFLISDNELVGEIPSKICNSTSLFLLDLSKNKLGGIIPDCLGNFSNHLSVVDLRENYFRGRIPTTWLEGGSLRSLNLNGNQLEGSVPQSLMNCKSLEVLDLGNNNLNDTFPYWLSTLPKLQVLALRSNRFHGDIQSSNDTFTFSRLRMIDLSRNEFTGHLPPQLFDNFKAMGVTQADKYGPKYMGDDYYRDSVTVTMKGSDLHLVRILTIFTIIDFSSNRFEGPIPRSVGELHSLIVLNFSHNSLTDTIPTSLGRLAALESLDLSSNKLRGRIPVQLTELTFLGALNLSQNHLEGPIPLANHFDTFSNDSFDGNSGLCGFPLSKKCGGNDGEPESPPPSTVADHESETALIWRIAAMGYGCGLVFGLSMGYIVFTTGRPRWIVKMIVRNPQRRNRMRIHPNRGRNNYPWIL